MSSQWIYELMFGSFCLFEVREDGSKKMVLMTDTIAMAYSKDDELYTLHKHGSPNKVRAWMEEARRKYMAAGHEAMANDLEMILFDPAFPLEEINRCLSTAGYLKRIVERSKNG